MRAMLMTTILSTACLLGASVSVANEQQRTELQQQLEIMNSILNTALGQQQGQQRRQRPQLDATYLAGQGVVYRLPLGQHRQFRWINGDGADIEAFEVILAPEAPMVPDAPVIDDGEALQSQVREVEVIIEHADIERDGEKIRMKGGRMFTEAQREVAEEMREAALKMAELRRQMRDLERTAAQASGQAKQEVQQQLEQLQAELAKAREQMAEAREALREAQGEMKVQVRERREAQAKQRAERVAQTEQVLVATLCDYGATLRALPDDEHVSVVLVGAGAQGKDKIHVFRKRDLSQCKAGKGASDLLSKATTYSF